MTDPDETPPAPPGKAGRKPNRSERLAEELRANLRRRKEQARNRTAPSEIAGPVTAGTDDESPPDRSGN